MSSTFFDLLIYLMAVFGFAYIVGHSGISMPLREALFDRAKDRGPVLWLVLWLECPACLGTWIGAAAGGISPSLFGFSRWWQGLIFGSLVTAAFNLVLGIYAGLITRPDDERSLRAEAEKQEVFMRIHELAESMAGRGPIPPQPPPAVPIHQFGKPAADPLMAVEEDEG